jgi:nucleotide-binding universal stress UspA family protein
LLGSVSRAVVERAGCSVLVARATSISRVVLATDGSASARHATSIVASWPLFRDVRTLVLGVIPEAADADTLEEAGAASNAAVVAAVEELAAANRVIEREVRVGDAGTQVVAAAESWAADGVVMGAVGEPFLRRLILGSVTRKVLDGVGASVLVARPRPATDAG